MMSLKQHLSAIFSDAFEAYGLDRKYGEVVISDRPDLGQFQCNGALAAAKANANGQKQNPRTIAQGVIDRLKDQNSFNDILLAGPGFINISLSDEFLAAHVQGIAHDERLGCAPVAQSRQVIVDFGGPNVAKPMHVGHLRSSVIGDSLQRLYRFMGNRVMSDIHLGDWGTPMGMLICELARRRPDLPYFNPAYTGPYPAEAPVTILDLQEMYPTASARCKQDEQEMAAALQATVELQQGRPGYRALWRHFVEISIKDLKEDFDGLGITFDLWLGESDYHDQLPNIVEQLQQHGQAHFSEGALVIPLAEGNGQPELPPLILVKSDGGYLYGTTDLATLLQRVNDFQADLILYVVDARQGMHFKQLFQAAHRLGLAQGVQLEHVAFGTVNGPDGKPFKSRAGGVMQLKELIALVIEAALNRMAETGIAHHLAEPERLLVARQVGIAALKYADLMNHRTSDYVFDPEKFTKFEGRTGPYLLYTAVRIKSILRKAEERAITRGPILPPTDQDRDLMLLLTQLPEAIQAAYLSYAPNHLCDFAYNLAQGFNHFYNRCHILHEADPARRGSWLALARLSLAELELLLSLLGIEIPERM
jgi:arginyl-tRNA synthetase